MINRLKQFRISWKIRNSGLFDREYYLQNNLDVARSCTDPIKHYVRYGWREGRNPCECFDTRWYLETYPDVAEAGINPLYHFLKNGFSENHNPSPDFSLNNRLVTKGRLKCVIDSKYLTTVRCSRLDLFFFLLCMGAKKPGILLKLISLRRLRSAFFTVLGKHEEPYRLFDRYHSIFGTSCKAEETLLQSAVNAKTKNGDIFVFPIIDWHFRIQRPQHIAMNLANCGYRVFYFTTVPILDDANHLFEIVEQPNSGVFLCKLRAFGPVQNIYHDTMSLPVMQAYRKSIIELMDRMESKATVSIVHLPYWKPLVDSIPGTIVGYDCMDHHAGFHSNSKEVPHQEVRLIQDADFVIASSDYLCQNIKRWRDAVLIRNGTEFKRLSEKPQKLLISKKTPIIGYIGAIAEWFDIELLMKSAKQYPAWQFVLVGGTVGCDEKAAGQLPNVEFVGEVSYDQVPKYLHAFDVAIIPFKIIELTKATNPVKVYEYLSAGKPVVATAMPELLLLEEHIHIAHSHDEFLSKLTGAMEESADLNLLKKRQKWASRQDWGVRAKEFDQVIQNNIPKVSIVILSYNNLIFTKACIESIEKNTFYQNYEVIIVDNYSEEETRAYLREYTSDKARYKLIENTQNSGFAAGNNIGIKKSTGEYIVLLNNDTYVSPGWLKALIKPLMSDRAIGLSGPVTNNIGNEAKIDIMYSDMRQMEKESLLYISQKRGKLLNLDVIAFFCVAIPRKIINEIGFLDERFGLGFFEDDDYCRRVKNAGYQIVVAEDSFVHHHLSASFDQLCQEREELFLLNKKIYEDKWGRWTPHAYRKQLTSR